MGIGRSQAKSDPSAFHNFFHNPTGTLPQQFLLSIRAEMRVFYSISMRAGKAVYGRLSAAEKAQPSEGDGLLARP
jgi:hypothetical protein